jgi:two-component system LytT family response regulator
MLSSSNIRVLVVDDEAPARLRILDLLSKDKDVRSVLEASDGEAAVRMILEQKPNLILLDMQMPELDGLGVVEAIGPENMPLTVFVTAYDQHAIRAFEANALDYVLKPYSDERMEAALARSKTRLDDIHLQEFGRSVVLTMATNPVLQRYLDRLAVKSGGITRFVRTAEIEWIEAAGVYVTLHVEGKELLHRVSLSELIGKLDPRQFIRIHRSAAINLEHVQQLEPLSHGEFEVILKNGSSHRVRRTYRALLEQRLGQTL